MKLKGLLFACVVLIGLGFVAFYPPVDDEQKEAILVQTILAGLDQMHYAPRVVDDVFSQQVYDLYIDRIDGGRRWLTQKDVDELKPYRDKLDDEIRASSFVFFNRSVELLKAGRAKTKAYFEEALKNPFDYSTDEFIELDGEKKPFAKDDDELRHYWHLSMKYETMTRLSEKIRKQEEGDEELAEKNWEQLEEETRAEVLKTFTDWYGRLEKRKRSDFLETYLNSITNVFDPHTGYFEPVDKQNFDIQMSGKLEGIGARLQLDGDFTKVTEVVVGGPAWKQGELEENDRIMKVGQGSEEPVNIAGMQLDDVVQLIRGKKGSEVRLTVRKTDGSTKIVRIIRDVVIFEEGFAKSLLLHTDANEKIGYISLPRFYADFNDRNGAFCSKDVAREIEKLKAENVQGIILDLRNNPGGSLAEVVKMSGLFIEEGPVVQVKSRDRKPELWKDEDSQVQWNGALIIMVNQFSASASEIIAAALQDYDRALVVGSQRTYGKGTVQRFFDLDRAISGNANVKPLGEIKLTIQKYYRVNGGTTQLGGVVPDIVLPDSYAYIDIGERELDYAMEETKIPPVPYRQNVYVIRNREELRQKAEQRMEQNPVFQEIERHARRIKMQRDKSQYSINLDVHRAEQDALRAEGDAFDQLLEIEVLSKIDNLAVDLPAIVEEEGKKARNEDWINNLRRDVHLMETLNIMHDLLASVK
jgi:carboxyl-terminal processing protease